MREERVLAAGVGGGVAPLKRGVGGEAIAGGRKMGEMIRGWDWAATSLGPMEGWSSTLVAAGMAMRAGYDWFYPYYRDRAICLALGNTVEEQLLQAVGAADDPASGGRQMPSHWSSTKLHIVTSSSAVSYTHLDVYKRQGYEGAGG